MPSATTAQHGHLVGYARTSTTDQKAGLAAQLRDLKAAGCVKVFHEELSSVATKRPQLDAALDYVREGDTMIVTKPDLPACPRGLGQSAITQRLNESGIPSS